MGLLDLLLQNQSNLDINPVPQPGNGPINPATGEFNTGVTPFQQVWDSNNTYLNNFNPNIQPNTLGQTGLDNTNPNFVPSTTLPLDNTNYPNLATGEYNSVSNQYSQVYSPNKTYLNNFNPNVQPNSLDETGLDIENIGLISTTAAPSPNTNYPNLSTGEFNGQSNSFNQAYTPVSTYLNTFNPQVQPNTIIQGQTGLDNTNPLSAPTTAPPIDPTTYPQFVQGEFNGIPTLYNQTWNPGFGYLSNYNPNIQPNTIIQGQTGLDNINPLFAPTATIPSTPTNYPNQATGEFGSNSNQYASQYGPNSTYESEYINDPVIFDTLQTTTLNQTGLDNTNPNFVSTTAPPNDPTQYPQFTQGEFNGIPTLYNQLYNPNNNYLNAFIAGGSIGIQPQTLSETGLDVDNPNFVPSTTTPNTLTQYPAIALGGLGQTAVQFLQIWNPVITYNNIVVGAPTSPLEQSLDETGLDNTNSNFTPTTVTPFNPTNYPNQSTGEFGGVSTQYTPIYGPISTYENKYINNPAIFDTLQSTTLTETGLDNSSNLSAPTTTTPNTPTTYPQFVQGEFNSVPTQFIQVWRPTTPYFTNYNPNIQPNTLGQTGLDVENTNAAPTTTVPIDPTQYPQFTQGEFNGVPSQYSQIWSPINQYIVNYNPNIQSNTINGGETGLDNTNLLAFNTTFVPNAVSAPTNYPQPSQTNLGEFGGAPSQFTPLYTPNPNQSYLDNYNTIISNAGNPQILNLGNTGLDVEDANAAPTTYVVPFLDNVTVYPALTTGEFSGVSTPYSQNYTPLLTYNNLVANTPQGPFSILEQSLGGTGLDVENAGASPTTYVVPGLDNITVYPPQATGEYNSAPNPFGQTYTPEVTYETVIINAVGGPASVIENSTQYTGLDIDNVNAAPTTYVVPEIDDTLYPVIQGAFTINRIPKPYKQTFTPTNQYYSYMINNFEGQII